MLNSYQLIVYWIQRLCRENCIASFFLGILGDIKFEEEDISIQHNIIFPLLVVFSICFHSIFRSSSYEIIIFHYFSTNKSLFEICVNNSCCLWCFRICSNCPSSHFIRACSEEIDEIKSFVSSLDNSAHH